MAKKQAVEESKIKRVNWVQINFRVPLPLRQKLTEEAFNVHKRFQEYMLALLDLRHESYDKLLTQLELRKSEKGIKENKK